MDTNNGIPNQGDWRGELHPVSRQRIVNKMTNDLKKHLSVSGQEGLLELQNFAQMFEEKIFTVATSQSDYLKKISMKMMLALKVRSQGTMVTDITSSLDMLTLETESQDTVANNITSSLDMETESLVTMANNITSSLDMETESQVTMANNISSNQVGPINKPPEPANGRPKQSDWRGKLPSGTRGRAVYNLLDILKTHRPFPGQEGLRQLRKLALRFEKRIFTAATSESDYARKIFLESLTIEAKLQGTLASNNMTWNQIGSSNKPLDPANGRPNQGDWRGTLQPGARERIVNIIMDSLKKQLPIVSGQEGSDEFEKIVQSFEEGIFTAAINKADYARQICLKTRASKTQCQDTEMNIIALKLTQLMK